MMFSVGIYRANMWIQDKGPSPVITDQSEGSSSGEAKVPATTVSTSDATDY